MTDDRNSTNKYVIDDLLYLMDRLRDPEDGCPWDLKQSFKTIVPHTIEETYEVVDAIERQDWPHLMDELGDLLFQVVFYARLGGEQNSFQWDDIVDNVVRKLLRRHPHVFPEGTLESRVELGRKITEAEINANWDRIKAEEKRLALHSNSAKEKQPASLLRDVPVALPAMSRALKIQKKASSVGFDWPDVAPVLAKVREELDELEQALKLSDSANVSESASATERDARHIEEEFGDILFACANLARFIKVDPEMALRRTNDKFIRRFQRVEALAQEQETPLTEATLEQMDGFWEQAKKEGI
ncbi:nucleoside triphosphate pyrophosphohydrolase [Hahella sp. CCB-MM4]|uniref:nucleoside triphosphate pyrophosphohydrolase n=1 Tax=Hahella sp. (strain CCB-MM4) TaxID=1926491 RepID=UPI000B9A4C6A|nr:nucleoside triphosphate pyrophosphohydrolase [Hahella sp. CCB-MM4]OZG70610.1 nucleoside triphosphate pyrophosphohydrolase [Hahella sp. CCB-MM4]